MLWSLHLLILMSRSFRIWFLWAAFFFLTLGLFFLCSGKFCLCNGYCEWYVVDFGFCYFSLMSVNFFYPGCQLTGLDSNSNIISFVLSNNKSLNSHLYTFQLLLFAGNLGVFPKWRSSKYLGIVYTEILWHFPFWDSSLF